VNNGDRIALFGRWIVDTGHDNDGHYRSEIHPPLLMASASVQSPKRGGRPVTRMLLVSRPYLHGQEFAQDVNNVYSDGVDDDGAMFDHLVKELARVVWGQSSRVEAHPKIKERPYRGRHELHLLVEPPPAPSGHDLVLSYQFTVRHGCNVRISAQSGDHVDVVVDLGQMRSSPPRPKRSERTYQPDQLDKLSSGAGLDIDVAKLAGDIAGALVGVGALYVYFVLRRGILTDEYAPLPAVDIHDTSHAVTNVPAQNITPGAGIVFDDEQPWPVIGWLEVIVPREARPGVRRERPPPGGCRDTPAATDDEIGNPLRRNCGTTRYRLASLAEPRRAGGRHRAGGGHQRHPPAGTGHPLHATGPDATHRGGSKRAANQVNRTLAVADLIDGAEGPHHATCRCGISGDARRQLWPVFHPGRSHRPRARRGDVEAFHRRQRPRIRVRRRDARPH
jgi:hypothetical protein